MKKASWNSNPDYDGINENSTDLEKLEVVFKILKKTNSVIAIDYRKLFIDYKKEKVFNAKLINTGLVEDIITSPGQYNPYFKLNNQGLLVFEEYETYSTFKEAVDNHVQNKNVKNKEKENLEIQKLRSENIKLVNDLSDYEKVKRQRNNAYKMAFISLIATITSVTILLLKYLNNK